MKLVYNTELASCFRGIYDVAAPMKHLNILESFKYVVYNESRFICNKLIIIKSFSTVSIDRWQSFDG